MKLAEIQAKLKAPKGQKNAHMQFQYRSAEDILSAVKPLLGETPLTLTDEVVMVGDRYYVKATATYGEHSVTAYAREAEQKKGLDPAQVTGAASSYARKYSLAGLFAIDNSPHDPDSKSGKDNEEIRAGMTPKQINERISQMGEDYPLAKELLTDAMKAQKMSLNEAQAIAERLNFDGQAIIKEIQDEERYHA